MRAAAHLVGYEKRIGRMNPEHLELLLSREMPFGKYKGRVIADLPGYYLAWLARKGFPPGQLGQLPLHGRRDRVGLLPRQGHQERVGVLVVLGL